MKTKTLRIIDNNVYKLMELIVGQKRTIVDLRRENEFLYKQLDSGYKRYDKIIQELMLCVQNQAVFK